MSRTMMTRQGDVVDQIALAYYGRTAGATEAVLDANPKLARLPARLPPGVIVVLPDLADTPTAARVKLWD